MRAFALADAMAVAALPSSTPVLAQAAGRGACRQAPGGSTRRAPGRSSSHIEASGGRAAILKHPSTRATGTYSVPAQGMNGSFEMLPPSRTR